MSQDQAHPAYRPDIDGLRAIAIVSVVLHHAFPEHIRGGFIGVDIFFVLSGYLISTIIFKGLERNRFRFTDFYARRVKRIFPALIVVLVATLIAGWYLLIPADLKLLGKHTFAGSVFLSNFAFWNEAGYFDATAATKPLLHLWSLAIEEQFYIFWPLILWALHRISKTPLRWILPLLFTSLALNFWLVRSDLTAAFYNPLGRFWEMMTGAVLAAMHVKQIDLMAHLPKRLQPPRSLAFGMPNLLATAGMVLLALLLWKLNPDVRFPGWWALIATLATCFLIAAGKEAWFNRMVLSSKPLVWIGLISYPLYLWHWPILAFAHIQNGALPSPTYQLFWVALSVLMAWLTYRFVERPIRFGRWNTKRIVTALLCASVASTGLAGYAFYAKDGYPDRFPLLMSNLLSKGGRDAITEGWRDGNCMLDYDLPASHYKPFCVEEKRRPLLFIWGDSHAGSLYPGFKALQDAGTYNFGIGERTGAICPPVLGTDPRPLCSELNDNAIQTIRASKPDIVLLYAWWHEAKVHGRYDISKLEATVAELKRAGVPRIILLGAVPYWKEDLPQILLKVWRQGSASAGPPLRLGDEYLDPHVRATTEEMRARSKTMGIEFISGMDYFCNAQGCLTRLNESASEPLTYDYGHLSLPAVTYYVQQLAPRIFTQP